MLVLSLGPLQSTTLPVLATYVAFAAFLSFTAFLAARNLLGDVSLRRHALVGPPIAAIAFLAATFELPSFLALAAALAVDAAAFRYLHDLGRRLLAAAVLIHFVVSVILGAMLFALVVLIGSAPV
ncbi:DUF7473 family protein [Halolamina salifodinae]|uniref:Uncharacterized protein n=1 Tax=Halolamina salifodinae TaxID=1202767 RepID=A0A8T4GXV1_9EURY|nr:hypothetical protein [Halolamina salifodinae]MBP1986414.1 hypothetical protein [Halolamina salifodinae]